jgi:hypothetical protein
MDPDSSLVSQHKSQIQLRWLWVITSRRELPNMRGTQRYLKVREK